MQMEEIEVSHRKEELRRALLELRDRGLHSAAKFAAELLSGTSPPLKPFNGIACSKGHSDVLTSKSSQSSA